ncbi:MAG: carboxymuconolactone decarboxylase family protein [Pseudomonadota bacterium]
MEQDRYSRGMEKLKEINGSRGEEVLEQLAEIAPALARFTVEFPYGDVYTRGVLSPKERAIVTLSALSAMGHAQPQLKVHINSALNVGCNRREIIEIFTQMAVYAGFPAALNAVFTARDVFAERDEAGLAD